MRVTFRAPLTDPSGVAARSRALLRGLVAVGADVTAEHLVWHWREVTDRVDRERFADLMVPSDSVPDLFLHHTHGRTLDPYAPAAARIGIIDPGFEPVPDDWITRANQMDGVVVPSLDAAHILGAAGVDSSRVGVARTPVELDRFTPDASPLDLADCHGTVFLAVLEWVRSSGWDALVDAWVRAFDRTDDVTLAIKTWSNRGDDLATVQAQLIGRIVANGVDPDTVADIVLIDDLLDEGRMAGLYTASDVVVSPGRSFGCRTTVLEALACGRPVIATGTPAVSAAVDASNGWRAPWRFGTVDAATVAHERLSAETRWADPDVDALVAAMRDAHASADGRRHRGNAARMAMADHDHVAVAAALLEQAASAASRRQGSGGGSSRTGVLVAGSALGAHSLAVLNRELARALRGRPELDVAMLDTQPTGLDDTAGALRDVREMLDRRLEVVDVTVRQEYPPCFDHAAPGHRVQYLPWEYGPAPEGWVAAQRRLDDVWVPSRWVYDHFVESGMDPERLHITPHGVDPKRFRPDVNPLGIDGAHGYTFLFVGGLLWRKGVDLLLDAFERAFTREDDVTLVIKDFGRAGPYVPQDIERRLAAMTDSAAGPRVLRLSGPMAESAMPGLYTACDCLVHPYRGEGYGLPIAEAMACGLPVVVPSIGAARDFTDEHTAVLVDAEHARMDTSVIGGLRLTGRARVVEVDVDALAAALRKAASDPLRHRELGARASARIRRRETWERAAGVVAARIAEIAARPIRHPQQAVESRTLRALGG